MRTRDNPTAPQADYPAPKPLTLAEFWDLLDAHDWYFEYSDDPSVWKRGFEARKRLDEFARISPAHEALCLAFVAHHFSGKPWNTPKAPKPLRPVEPTP